MSYWNEKITIKNITFPRFMSGPLDGVTDSPFRKMVRDFSKDELLYTEMRHVGCVYHQEEQRSVTFCDTERPLNFQFSANKLDFIEKACQKVLQRGVDSVDLNIGCPARHIVGSGSGSALMGDIPRLKKILTCFRENLEDIPFTVKMRAGFKEVNAIDTAKLVQDHGADAIAIHPRLQTQKFAGMPDYKLAADIKKALDIPVFFSGGIVDFQDAKMVHEKTGVDGFLIGRGMWGAPWKLKELSQHAAGKEFKLDKTLILKCALKHLDNQIAFYGANGLYSFRKHLTYYVKGMPFAGELRKLVFSTSSIEKVKEYIASFWD